MLNKIRDLLEVTPKLKAKEIAKKLGYEKQQVNSLVYENNEIFERDGEFRWSLAKPEHLDVFLDSNPWVTVDSFELNLKSVGCLLSKNLSSITFIFPEKCQILLVAGARLIALVNQLACQGKSIKLDFEKCPNAKHYLNRLGFFDYLDERIETHPAINRISSRARIYHGNSENLFEIASIDPSNLDESIPEMLTKKFTKHSGDQYYTAVFTMFSELIGNIYDHSDSEMEGFAALQKYNGRRSHIQTVVSDSGLGIATTIKENLEEFYPELLGQRNMDDIETDIFLVSMALTEGRLSRHGPNSEKARGLGLKRTQEFAIKYDAETRIRQEEFELLIKENSDGKRSIEVIKGLTRILGTHICFDFYLD